MCGHSMGQVIHIFIVEHVLAVEKAHDQNRMEQNRPGSNLLAKRHWYASDSDDNIYRSYIWDNHRVGLILVGLTASSQPRNVQQCFIFSQHQLLFVLVMFHEYT